MTVLLVAFIADEKFNAETFKALTQSQGSWIVDNVTEQDMVLEGDDFTMAIKLTKNDPPAPEGSADAAS